jgi:hypothetical protein
MNWEIDGKIHSLDYDNNEDGDWYARGLVAAQLVYYCTSISICTALPEISPYRDQQMPALEGKCLLPLCHDPRLFAR